MRSPGRISPGPNFANTLGNITSSLRPIWLTFTFSGFAAKWTTGKRQSSFKPFAASAIESETDRETLAHPQQARRLDRFFPDS